MIGGAVAVPENVANTFGAILTKMIVEARYY